MSIDDAPFFEAYPAPWRIAGDEIIDAVGNVLNSFEGESAAEIDFWSGIVEAVNALNVPETKDFARGVGAEAAQQRFRWGSDHDERKGAFDWFWLIGYLAQKAADAAMRGDVEKARHNIISTAAALANWHRRLCGSGVAPADGAK